MSYMCACGRSSSCLCEIQTPVTAASGADTFGPTGGFHSTGRATNSANAPASGADQPALRDQQFRDALEDVLVQTVGRQMPRGKVWRPGPVLDALLPLIEADRERAKAEGGAAAVHAVAEAIDADPYIAHLVSRNAAGAAIDAAVILASSRAQALRGST